MNEALFANQKRLGAELYAQLAEKLALNPESFSACLMDPRTQQRVQRDLNDARRLRMNSTPSFVLGRCDGKNMQVALEIRDDVDFDALAFELELLLAAPTPSGHAVAK
jgi:predicted DsbA family dithiol-disulfide isomerase